LIGYKSELILSKNVPDSGKFLIGYQYGANLDWLSIGTSFDWFQNREKILIYFYKSPKISHKSPVLSQTVIPFDLTVPETLARRNTLF